MNRPQIAVVMMILGAVISPRIGLAGTLTESGPNLLLTADDLARARRQLSDPDFSARVDVLENKCQKEIAQWHRLAPKSPRRDTEELLQLGRGAGNNFKPWMDAWQNEVDLSVCYALRPTPELAQTAREMLIVSLGLWQIKNNWNADGIHDAVPMDRWLKGYGLLTGTGVFDDDDRRAIEATLHQAGHYFDGWLLDSFSFGFPDRRENGYCLNYHIVSGYVLASIAMYFPQFPESAKWLRAARGQMVEELMTEMGIDGGGSEGAINYWYLSMTAMVNMMVEARNANVADYFSDPTIADAVHRTLDWRLAVTAPDGNVVAIGDSVRSSQGINLFAVAGRMLGAPELSWLAQDCWQRGEPGEMDGSYSLLVYDTSADVRKPEELFDVFPWSGYASSRSGWDPSANYFFLKYGTTWIGRRENQPDPIIPGHAHSDCLEIELHFNGQPVLVDSGKTGFYGTTPIYGGYMKATIGRNTVGLGNPWGYSRLDGQYEQHVRDHGPDFLYEQSQKMIGRADSHLIAFGDTGAAVVVSARVNTYSNVTHQRTAVWFRDNSVVVLDDSLQSDSEQPYELYLNPPGNLLQNSGVMSFGRAEVKLDIDPVLPKEMETEIIQHGDPRMPPYYCGLNSTYKETLGKSWASYSLLVEKKKSRDAHFLNVLIPYSDQPPYSVQPLGEQGTLLRGAADQIAVSPAGDAGSFLKADTGFGVVRSDGDAVQYYVLHGGRSLSNQGRMLVRVALKSMEWSSAYTPIATVSVSLKDHRASVSLPLSPFDTQNMIWWPGKTKQGNENDSPLQINVSFHVDSEPKRVIAEHSVTDRAELTGQDDESTWPNDFHQSKLRRRSVPFSYDPSSQLLTVTLDAGTNQLVWE